MTKGKGSPIYACLILAFRLKFGYLNRYVSVKISVPFYIGCLELLNPLI